MRRADITLAATLACAGFAVGQSTPASAVPSLHSAWLAEVMDLDVAGAAAAYRKVAADTGPRHLERWVAAARLAELQRLGAVPAAPIATADAPTALRPAFLALQPIAEIESLVDRARRAPAEGLQILVPEAGKLSPLRSAVPPAEDWVMSQIGPSLRDRMRQWRQTLANRSRSTDTRRVTERLYALDVVRAELQGRPAQAIALRTLYFADWRPPVAAGDPAPHLARIRANLDAWLADPELGSQQQPVLRELKDAIDKQAAADPAAAVNLVMRLPLYAERLLEEPRGAPRSEPSRR